MPDPSALRDDALVAAFLAKGGKVTVCPPKTFSPPTEMKFDGWRGKMVATAPAAAPQPEAVAEPMKRRGRPRKDTAPNLTLDAKKAERAERAVAKVRDRRRFKATPVPTGDPAKALTPDHPAAVEGRTLFPSRVMIPSDAEPVLKDGASSSKIGGDVLVGRLKGAKILTLTLEERATCPRSCALWLSCYGGGMQFARRWKHGPELEARIADEVAAACAVGPVLVRLHVLGDFYSVEYVELWWELLNRHPNLHAFGFTAWGPDTEIGIVQPGEITVPELGAGRMLLLEWAGI